MVWTSHSEELAMKNRSWWIFTLLLAAITVVLTYKVAVRKNSAAPQEPKIIFDHQDHDQTLEKELGVEVLNYCPRTKEGRKDPNYLNARCYRRREDLGSKHDRGSEFPLVILCESPRHSEPSRIGEYICFRKVDSSAYHKDM